MIQVSELRFRHGGNGFLLEIPTLHPDRGESLAIIGPSGSGKTTFLQLIAGVLMPDAGEVAIDEKPISSLSDAARRNHRLQHIGMIFQEFELLAHLDVLDNILLPFRLHPDLELTPAVRERATRLADQAGVGDKLKRPVTRLSQGERQRVAVCRALVTEPRLLLCDEPTGNLDPKTRNLIVDMLFSYQERHGATLLTVTHDHDLLERFDRVVDFTKLGPA
jgi:putative ABC transport system ATP-binding protein